MRVLWSRAPMMLFRFRSLLIAIATVAMITATTAASGPAFIRSTEIGSIQDGVEQANRWTAGFRVLHTALFFPTVPPKEVMPEYLDFVDLVEDVFTEHFAGTEGLDGPYTSIVGSEISARGESSGASVRLVYRTDAFDHVTLLEGGQGDGVWLADEIAENIDVGVGDELKLVTPAGRTTTTVAAIYRHLPRETPRPFWTVLVPYIYKAAGRGNDTDPPALLLADKATQAELMFELRDLAFTTVEFPLSGEELTVNQARALAASFTEAQGELLGVGGPLGAGASDYLSGVIGDGEATSPLTGIVRSAEERVDTVAPVVDLLTGAALIIALAVTAAAGFFLVKRRRIEIRTLLARGIGPLRQAIRYGVEALVPLSISLIAGTGLAFMIVSKLGPARTLSPGVLVEGLDDVAIAGAVSLVIVVIAAATAVWREERDLGGATVGFWGQRWVQLGIVAAVAIGGLAYRASDAVSAAEGLDDQRVTIIPVALIFAVGVLASSAFLFLLPRVASKSRSRSPALYLASKRLVGASGMTRLLVIACAWALGIAVYGFTASSSVDDSATAKAKLFVGSDLSALVGTEPVLEDMPFDWTHVTRISRAPFAQGGTIALMGIDKETFADAAFWRSALADASLDDLVRELGPSQTGTLRVISTSELPDGAALTSHGELLTLEVVATVDAFPGQVGTGPFVIAERSALLDSLSELGVTTSGRSEELWAEGDPAEIEEALRQSDVSFSRTLWAEDVLDTPGIQSLLWMLGLLAAIGTAAAAIAVMSLLLYLQARQRAALVASALTRRMGLSRRSEFSSWLAEIAGALMVSLLVGIGAGLSVTALMRDRLDPRPNIRPDVYLVVPIPLLAGLAAALVAIAIFMAWRVRRTADSTDIAQIMRT